MTSGLKFLKPADEASWQEDKVDIDVNNSTTFVFNPFKSLSLEQQQQKLPVYKNRDHILYLLEKNQVVVIVGETGCGKSTQVPQYLMEAGWTADNKCIAVTQPRRVAAASLAARVADEVGVAVGQEVGYNIRFDEKVTPKVTKIKYMTEGILIREMMNNPLLSSYSVVMLDEVHERTVNGDVLMGLLRKILKKRKDLKLIVSSATVDAEAIQKFFTMKGSKGDEVAAVISIAGRSHQIEIFYATEPIPDYVKGAVETVIKIHMSDEKGDILVFLTGSEEVDEAVSLLKDHASRLKNRYQWELMPLPMYGSLPPRDQLKVFHNAPKGSRKVVVATNIAETSITIDGIVFGIQPWGLCLYHVLAVRVSFQNAKENYLVLVVDSGFMKIRTLNTETLTDALVVVPTSKASAEQRAGRAGRTRRGKVFRLYQEAEFNQFNDATPPEIQRSDFSLPTLQLKSMGIDNIPLFNFPSPPPAKNVIAAIELLFALGALDSEGALTTPLGERMSELPMHPTLSKCLLSSSDFGCSSEIASILAMLQVENIFVKPYGQASLAARVAKRKFEVEEGDLITYLNVFTEFSQNENKKQFCSQNFLSYKRLSRAALIRNQMIKSLGRFSLPIVSCKGELEPILKCLTVGFFPNAVYLHHSGKYRTVRGDLDVTLHPLSVLYTSPQPQWLIFSEVVQTKGVFIRDVTVIEPGWLEELAPHFYRKKTEYNH